MMRVPQHHIYEGTVGHRSVFPSWQKAFTGGSVRSWNGYEVKTGGTIWQPQNQRGQFESIRPILHRNSRNLPIAVGFGLGKTKRKKSSDGNKKSKKVRVGPKGPTSDPDVSDKAQEVNAATQDLIAAESGPKPTNQAPGLPQRPLYSKY